MKMIEAKRKLIAQAKSNLAAAKAAYKAQLLKAALGGRAHAAMANAAAPYDHVSVSAYAYASGRVMIDVGLQVDNLKDDKALAVMIMAAMNVLPGAVASNEDYASWGSREYAFEQEGVTVKIDARIKDPDGGGRCRREVIGVEMVEQKKYKIVCD